MPAKTNTPPDVPSARTSRAQRSGSGPGSRGRRSSTSATTPESGSKSAHGPAHAVAVRTNSQGFRDREYPPKASSFRILGLGDSFTFGFGVEEGESFLALVEDGLRDGAVEVINGGLVGGGPESAARLLEVEGPRLEPDLVVLGFYAGNDARINATLPKTTEAMAELKKTFEPVTYEGAGHGFMRAGEAPNANEANKKARDEAWARWKKILAGI